MSYTATLFDVKDHRPEPLLGHQARLPELVEFSERAKISLENPIASYDQAQHFMDAMDWFATNYDQKLDQAHWGVFTARTLEAMFWRIADLLEETPRWGIKEQGLISHIIVHCESLAMNNLARDMTISIIHPPGTCPENSDCSKVEYPPTDRDFLIDTDASSQLPRPKGRDLKNKEACGSFKSG